MRYKLLAVILVVSCLFMGCGSVTEQEEDTEKEESSEE